MPPVETRPALPATFRAWLGARNPLLIPYLGWSTGFTVLTLGNVFANATGNPGSSWADVAMLATAASLPLFPIVGFHLNQARRQFQTGHSLADLRSALELARRERAETEALTQEEGERMPRRLLRQATIASATWLAVTFGLLIQGTIHEQVTPIAWVLAPIFVTMLLGAVSNALDIQFIPNVIRDWWQTGIRDRLWNSRAGEWLARRLGAPQRSRAVGGGVFRPTESALGVAASELFAALPSAHREQLAELPATVAALEQRAAAARAELEAVAALAPAGDDAGAVLATRREKAAAHLASSVAALEGIRLDLLRLHAGASDLAPLTTLIDDARAMGDDIARLADAQRELNGPSPSLRRVATPV